MLVTKNRIWRGALIFLPVIFLAGCSPPGTRALLSGKKFLDRGDYASAVVEFKTATSLLPTNAAAWNYYGVALQDAGQLDDAATAYQRALVLDRDLVEAHYNLGCLWLEQNKIDEAKTEFIAYTLRRSNTPEGWLKLGEAQLRANEIVSAEKSFSTAYYWNSNSAEALNGLGLAQIQRERPEDAAKFFAAAVRAQPDYAPAILNLAVAEQQYLHDDKSALDNYRAYLALTPRPANWNEVTAIVSGLEHSPAVAVVAPPPATRTPPPVAPTPPTANETRTPTIIRPAVSPRASVPTRYTPTPPPATRPTEVVQVPPEPVIVTQSTRPLVTTSVVEVPTPPTQPKPSIWNRLNPAHWFGSSASESNNNGDDVTRLPQLNPAATHQTPLRPVASHPAIPPPPTFPRYAYLSPAKPAAGDRAAAFGWFTHAREMEQASHWTDAMEAYRQATKLDPSWFEAQYNFGVLSYRLGDYRQALAAYETALAIQPDSADARYNFALTLTSAGYAVDAEHELEKILSANPNEVRAQLALANLCAQQLRDPARARPHYLKVLELDPHNPKASEIQFWLAQNPP